MSTPAELMDLTRATLNDQDGAIFNNTVLLPYFNMALKELQETFEMNNIPVNNRTSEAIPVDAGVHTIAYTGTIPVLPYDLIEIYELWESPRGQEQWTPMARKNFLPHDLQNNTQINQFLLWAWYNQEIHLIAANADNDLKIDYLAYLFTPLQIGAIDVNITVKNVDTFLYNMTGAFAAYFIGENETRALALQERADVGLQKSLQISTKGRQSIPTRRRPYRAGYKHYGNQFYGW